MTRTVPISSDIAVIGYAARLPGAQTAEEAARILMDGRCTISEIPQDRWSHDRFYDPDKSAPGKTYAKRAGLLNEAFAFDAAYFGITPREAEQMDPQQRLLLQVVARAFDHAAIDPSALNRDRTGVFVGASAADHSTTALQDPDMIDAQYMLGNTLSILANRISYQWDLRGPSYVVDTACSSSFFALDQARRAIEAGEIDTAIVAGVNLLLSPLPFIGFSKAAMLSEEGLCRAFGEGGTGYVRSEGAVAFVLRRADLARLNHDRIRSILVATGVNTDGRTSGIALPSARRQADLIADVMARHDFDPDDLAFVEAHGTGTAVGDPLEAQALGETYGAARRIALPIGSAKTNFGHLEPASGLVGLLKTQIALELGTIPASLHAEVLNKRIDFEALNLEVLREARLMPRRDRPWIAAVNSFGFGGANAHVVLRQPDASDRPRPAAGKLAPALLLSAATPAALEALVAAWVDLAPEDLPGAVATANHRLARHRHRLCLPAGSAETLTHALATGRGQRGEAPPSPARVAFVFSGNGAQWDGMGRHLYARDPVFRKSFNQTAELFKERGGPDIVDLLLDSALGAKLGRAPVAQPLLFALQLAVVDALAAQGLRPHATLGHSVGEVAAACAAGKLSRASGVRIIHSRSLTLDLLHEQGAMAALIAEPAAAKALIDELGLAVEIAAVNAPASLTLAGNTHDLNHLMKVARRRRMPGKVLPIDYPYHSSAVDPLRARMQDELSDIAGKSGGVTLYSGCRAGTLEGEDLDAGYWWDNAREPVRFMDAVQAAAAGGIGLLLEVSPKSVLKGYIRDSVEAQGRNATVLGSLEETDAEHRDALSIARSALVHGAQMDEGALLGGLPECPAATPTYPFERQIYALGSSASHDIFGRVRHHPLLGARRIPDVPVHTGTLSLGRLPWLADHKVAGRVLLPATAMLEMMLAAVQAHLDMPQVELADLEILRPITLEEGKPVATRVTLHPASRRLTLEAQSLGAAGFSLVAFASYYEGDTTRRAASTLKHGKPAGDLYAHLAQAGLEYGPAFAKIEALAMAEGEVTIRLGTSDLPDGFALDPTLADAALHATPALLAQSGLAPGATFVPGRVGRLRLFGPGPVRAARLHLRRASIDGIHLDLDLYDAEGQPVAELHEIRLRPMPQASGAALLYWDETLIPLALPDRASPGVAMAAAVEAMAPLPGDEPSDLEVLRAAIAGRAAYDLVARGLEGADAQDARFEAALSGLIATEAASLGTDGTPELSVICPWPTLDVILPVLTQTVPQAQDLLQDTLALATRAPVEAGGAAALIGAAQDLLARSEIGAMSRVLLVGAADPVLAKAAGRAGYLVHAAVNEDAAALLRLTYGDVPGLRITTLEALQPNAPFDLVLGIGTSQALTPSARKALPALMRAGGELALVEHAADLFSLMAGHHRAADALDRMVAGFVRMDLPVRLATLARHAGVAIVVGCRPGVADIALDLPDLTRPAEPADPLARMQAEAEALRTAPEGWLAQEEGGTLAAWARSVGNETGTLRRVVSIAPGADAIAAAALSDTGETEIMARRDGAFAPRLVPVALPPAPVAGSACLRLRQSARGQFEALEWRPEARPEPGPQELEIAVAATGLNFRDVMWAQGLLPAEALETGFAGPTLGMECSGVVTRAGREAGFKVGARVIAFAPGAFSSHVTLPATSVIALPDAVDLIAAASIPVIFLTADYALHELARIEPGETVLIHGAAGGVGLAAVQIAQNAGAKVIATAGSPQKRAFLRALGVRDVFDSRKMRFPDQVARATDGHGVDVVLNSLAGAAMEKSLGCLAPFGRFVELGKRDFYANSALGMRVLRNNITYFGVDADQLLGHRPQAAARVMARVAKGFAEDSLVVPPLRVFEPEQIGQAFRLMQKSGHIGKIVVKAPAPPAEAVQPAPIRDAWLVIGGNKGFGLETARWLARRGASSLWLVSRSGAPPSEDLGIPTEVLACDVTDAGQVADLLARIDASGQRLGGVVHGAMVLEDALFKDLTAAQIARVLAPKVTGAHVLDTALGARALDHFWLYGSVSVRFGNPGQSAYVAANAALEGLARARRAAGRAGLAIAWGPIADAGYLARAEQTRDVIRGQLGTLLEAREALDALGEVLARDPARATITIAPMYWARLKSDVPLLGAPLFEMIDLTSSASESGDIDLMALIADVGVAKARKQVLDLLVGETARIMRIAPSEIDPARPLMEMGFDSLMGMNLKLAAEARLGADLPIASVADGLSLQRMAHDLIEAASQGKARDAGLEMADKHLTQIEISEEVKAKVMKNVAAE